GGPGTGPGELRIDQRTRRRRAEKETPGAAVDGHGRQHDQVLLQGKDEVDLFADGLVVPWQQSAAGGEQNHRQQTGDRDCGQRGFRVHTHRAATPAPEDSIPMTTAKISEFKNEPLTDFTKPEHKAATEVPLQTVKVDI